MSIFKKISNIFAPEPEKSKEETPAFPQVDSPDGEVSMTQLLDAIGAHFNKSLNQLSTKYNLLYNTSFTIYLRAVNYPTISAALPFLAGGAEKMLTQKIKEDVKKRGLTDYRPHSQYWQFQLVEIPADAVLDGLSEEDIADGGALIQISSELFPPVEGADGSSSASGDGRVVTTMHGVSSLKAIRNCINPDILAKLDLIEKDRVRLMLNLYDESFTQPAAAGFSRPVNNVGDVKTNGRKAAAGSVPTPAYFATLQAEDGEFLEGMSDRKIHTVAITANEVHICGRSSQPGAPGIEVLRVASDRVMTPHVKIRRDPATGLFTIAALGHTTVTGRTLRQAPDAWKPLPHNSVIMLDGEVQLRFKINK